MKAILRNLGTCCLLLAGITPAQADDIKYLLCSFKYGAIKVDVNYTAETVNGTTAMIDDKEITWSPPGENSGLAVINRYTGVMQMSRGNQQYTGMCNRLIPKK
jgi:hypothetical protein